MTKLGQATWRERLQPLPPRGRRVPASHRQRRLPPTSTASIKGVVTLRPRGGERPTSREARRIAPGGVLLLAKRQTVPAPGEHHQRTLFPVDQTQYKDPGQNRTTKVGDPAACLECHTKPSARLGGGPGEFGGQFPRRRRVRNPHLLGRCHTTQKRGSGGRARRGRGGPTWERPPTVHRHPRRPGTWPGRSDRPGKHTRPRPETSRFFIHKITWGEELTQTEARTRGGVGARRYEDPRSGPRQDSPQFA